MNRTILLFFGKFFLLYVGLLLLFLGTDLHKSYRDGFSSVSNGVYRNLSSAAEIYAYPIDNQPNEHDLLFKILNKEHIKAAQAEARQKGLKSLSIDGVKWSLNSTRWRLMPLLFLLALIFAYPSAWKPKLIALGAGLVLFYLYTLFFLGGSLLFKIHENQVFFPDYELPSFVADFFYFGILNSAEINYIVMVLIWGVVCVRVEDFKRLMK